ncbi:MAG: isocitrate/isopropylmalate family dehydrogenase [Candidatus Helarchaeota archaeon]
MKKVTCIGGEGIGVEVVNATIELIEGMALPGVELIKQQVGEAAEYKHGKGVVFPDEVKESIQSSDAVLFGAAYKKSKEVLHYLRFDLDNYAHLRPCKYYEGLSSPLADPSQLDILFVREGMESLYAALRIGEGTLEELYDKNVLSRTGKEWEKGGNYALKIVSEYNCKRIARFACEQTVRRKKRGHRGRLTIVHKANVLPKTDGYFRQIAYEVAARYRKEEGILINDYFVDDMARRIVKFPEQQDVLLCLNEYGDILSDMTAELAGGIGLAPSGCFGGKIPYFEPIHGSAPDIAGMNISNPIATILSAKMMLDYLQFKKEATMLEEAVREYFLLAKDPKKNWIFLPRDLVPPDFQSSKKFCHTRDVARKVLKIYHDLIDVIN